MMDQLLLLGLVFLLMGATSLLAARLMKIEEEVERLSRQVWRLESTVEFGTEPQP